VSFVVTAADLNQIKEGNKQSKFADDLTSKSSTVQDEMSHIADWSQLNQAKSKEIVFVASHTKTTLIHTLHYSSQFSFH